VLSKLPLCTASWRIDLLSIKHMTLANWKPNSHSDGRCTSNWTQALQSV
jgi:hypothetical protein